MPVIIQRFIAVLNQYANLILVAITTVYVYLNWRSLRALREASLREREARHLQEIKEQVIHPIVSWINGTVFDRFTTSSIGLLTVSGGYAGLPRRLCSTVDDPFVPRRPLDAPADSTGPNPLATWTSTETGRIAKFLYEHTRRDHFPAELSAFDGLVHHIAQILNATNRFANQCAEDIANAGIPKAASAEDEFSMPEWANPWLLAAECIQALMLGKKGPGIQPHAIRGGHELTSRQNQTIARAARSDQLEEWYDRSVEQIRAKWDGEEFPAKINDLLTNAASVRRTIETLLFTHSLGVDCELVSGRKH